MIMQEMKKLNPSKEKTFKNIPCKILRSNWDICAPALTKINNVNVNINSFPDKMKEADVTPVHKKDEVTSVKNYKPISVLHAAF